MEREIETNFEYQVAQWIFDYLEAQPIEEREIIVGNLITSLPFDTNKN